MSMRYGGRRRSWRERRDYWSRTPRGSVALPLLSRWLTLVGGAIVISALALAAWLAAGVGDGPRVEPAVALKPVDDIALDFIAAENTTYHQNSLSGTEGDEIGAPAPSPEGQDLGFDDRTTNVDVVEQLEAEEFACEDRIVFFTEIVVDEADGVASDRDIFLVYHFDAINNGQQGVGYSDVLADINADVLNDGVGVRLTSGLYDPSMDAETVTDWRLSSKHTTSS